MLQYVTVVLKDLYEWLLYLIVQNTPVARLFVEALMLVHLRKLALQYSQSPSRRSSLKMLLKMEAVVWGVVHDLSAELVIEVKGSSFWPLPETGNCLLL